MKAGWRSASTMSGVLCVMTPGELQMLLWCVDSWDTQLKVYIVIVKKSKKCDCSKIKNYRYMSTDAVAFRNAHYGVGAGPIYLNNVDCSGSEKKLLDCSRSMFSSCSGGHWRDAGARCQGS